MTFTEILKAKGLSDKDVESVIGEMKQNKIFTAHVTPDPIAGAHLDGSFFAVFCQNTR